MDNIIIATIKSWNIDKAIKLKNEYIEKYNVELITNRDDLSVDRIRELNPKYIFFPHWSWIIPNEIYKNFKCIVFHTADLPHGRGGSPIQNQISMGIKKSRVCAIDVVEELDAGDIYCSEYIDLSKGSADEILIEVSEIIFNNLIPFILTNNPVPYTQEGELFFFKRRKSDQSNLLLNEITDLSSLYDFIRMLDGEGYPKAYIDLGNTKIEFSNVNKRSGFLEGKFTIYEK
jgi:methionyl-tRNA formyltransferase